MGSFLLLLPGKIYFRPRLCFPVNTMSEQWCDHLVIIIINNRTVYMEAAACSCRVNVVHMSVIEDFEQSFRLAKFFIFLSFFCRDYTSRGVCAFGAVGTH